MDGGRNQFGETLRRWRRRRRFSQLALAMDAGISQRHLSFLESGRSSPSREMILRLAETLGVPLRDRNAIFVAAGYAPRYPERAFDSPGFEEARAMIGRILDGHLPHPALAIDRYWNLRAANRGVQVLLEGVAPALLSGEINVMRLALHPDGLALRIPNLAEWRSHSLARLRHEIEISADPKLVALREELEALPAPSVPRFMSPPVSPSDAGEPGTARDWPIALPFQFTGPFGTLSFLSTTTVFGTAVDATLSDTTIEAFLPADRETAEAMARLVSPDGPNSAPLGPSRTAGG